jgi:hypothetical protein
MSNFSWVRVGIGLSDFFWVCCGFWHFFIFCKQTKIPKFKLKEFNERHRAQTAIKSMDLEVDLKLTDVMRQEIATTKRRTRLDLVDNPNQGREMVAKIRESNNRAEKEVHAKGKL